MIGQINYKNKLYSLVPITNSDGLLMEVSNNNFQCGNNTSNTNGGVGPDAIVIRSQTAQ